MIYRVEYKDGIKEFETVESLYNYVLLSQMENHRQWISTENFSEFCKFLFGCCEGDEFAILMEYGGYFTLSILEIIDTKPTLEKKDEIRECIFALDVIDNFMSQTTNKVAKTVLGRAKSTCLESVCVLIDNL